MGNRAPRLGLTRAVAEGDETTVRNELASLKIDINDVRNEDGKTLLEIAVAHKRVRIVECLLQAGANPQVVNRYQNTPLHTAAGMGEVYLIEVLLKYNASPNIVNVDGMTPLDCCIHWQKTQPAQASNENQNRAEELLRSRGGYAAKFSTVPMAVTDANPVTQAVPVPVKSNGQVETATAVPVKY